MNDDDVTWFETWISALESPHCQIDALGVDGTIAVAYGETFLVQATLDRVTPLV